ncbi:hypothetical protein BJ944DRAFT_253913 [Cunninghamella echinulata]|nr:hypothetical protein BJ944DRAFT_253913 [Cunninghamella echinulata]
MTICTIGAAGAVAYSRRNSMNNTVDPNGVPIPDNSPHAIARRRSSALPDSSYDARKQAEYQWRRDYGINFSHNSNKRFPADLNQISK